MTTTDLAAALDALPEIGKPIFLVLGDGINFRSRLEAVDGDTFRVTSPLETAAPAGVRPGHVLDVFWAPPRTRVVMPCRLAGVADEAPYHWILAPSGPAEQSNRREFARGGAGAAVRLVAELDDESVEGRLLDISEGGLRCAIPRSPQLRPGDRMRAVLWLGTGEVQLEGAIHDIRDAHDDPGQNLILVFQTKDPVAQMIRQYVIAWEIGERRRAVRG
ncbi:PilZ domain-containing protein [Actinoplanes sp. NPDC051851]|uniref:PilZ domain-containing protein n=1 Tax=Actinoplanes sp. NPDC051851 TaxID=3154753 RepID=UPI0034232241